MTLAGDDVKVVSENGYFIASIPSHAKSLRIKVAFWSGDAGALTTAGNVQAGTDTLGGCRDGRSRARLIGARNSKPLGSARWKRTSWPSTR